MSSNSKEMSESARVCLFHAENQWLYFKLPDCGALGPNAQQESSCLTEEARFSCLHLGSRAISHRGTLF